MFNTAGIILVGGQSRRMGRDKAYLPLPGHEQITFVEHLTHLLTSVCSETVLVARDEQQAAAYAASRDDVHIPTTVHIVSDKVPASGPLMGLYTGLCAIQTTHALVAAVDMPFLQREMVTFLLSQTQDEAILLPVAGGIPQVLLAVYPRAILSLLEERLQAGRRDPRSLLDIAQVRYIEEAQLRTVDPQLRSFVNINTPADLHNSRF